MAECGTWSAYCAGCHCLRCDEAQYQYKTRYRFDLARGLTRQVENGPVTEHLKKLHEEGWSDEQIAASCGVSLPTVTAHRLGLHPRIQRTIADQLLSATPTPGNVSATSKVRGLGSTRRARALVAIGHSLNTLTRETRLARSTVGRVTSGCSSWIAAETAQVVAETYERMSGTLGASDRSRAYAQRNGWAPPLAWDDIDDPNEVPDFGEEVPAYVANVENYKELARIQGYSQEAAAARLGISLSQLKWQIAHYNKKNAA
ncbi:hypothetical protein ABT282_07895 [Streptomyces sp. NPDC000927]|uniref:hypothetical protein n=1 Tax=Streptomyces sp. NPDC000927 TaxID=3154371 RepID=UPI003327B19C